MIGQPVPAFGFGLLAAPMLNFSFGGGGGGGGFGGGPGAPMGGPGPGGPPGGPAPPPDEVALMTQRLQSFYWNNRKEAAYKLGQLGDPRAVPLLIHVLKYDYHKDVHRFGHRTRGNRRFRECRGPRTGVDLRSQRRRSPRLRNGTRAIEREGQGLTAHVVGTREAAHGADASRRHDVVSFPGGAAC